MSIADKLTRAKQDIDDVYEAGQKSENKKTWDAIQDYGNRTVYTYGFAYNAWDDETFNPRYDIKPIGSMNGLFRDIKVVDLEGTLQRCGVILDTSQATSMNVAFASIYLQTLPTIDMTSVTGVVSNANLAVQGRVHTIRKIICVESTPWSGSSFSAASGLINLEIEGIIGQSGLDLHWSKKLSKASITSVINALSTTTSGLSITLSKTAVDTAFDINVDEATTYPEGSEYYVLRHSKDNWTINYL